MEKQKEELFMMSKSRKPTLAEWTMQNGIILNQKSKPKTTTTVGAIHESPAKTTTVTTKTRDPFLEGFYSVEDKPETEKRTYLQHRNTPTQLSSRPKRRDLNESVRLARNDTGSAQTNVGAGVLDRPHSHTTLRKAPTQNPQPIKLPYRPSVQGPPKMTKYGKQTAPTYDSPVKIVGDNVTEKDYEDFWEAFRKESTGEKTYEDNFWGQFGANYQESRMKKDADEARYKYYKDPTPENKKHFEDLEIELDNFRKNNAEVLADDASLPLISQGLAKIAPEIVDNVKNSLVYPGAIGAVLNAKDDLQGIELHFMDKHYARNDNNGDIPQHISELPKDWYREDLDYCHQFDVPGRDNQKYVSPDGKREVVFDANGYIVTDDKNKGTYNYYSAQTDKAGHFFHDMIPWYFWGNTPEDETTCPERVLSTFQIYTDGY